jgi:hypothetical protein
VSSCFHLVHAILNAIHIKVGSRASAMPPRGKQPAEELPPAAKYGKARKLDIAPSPNKADDSPLKPKTST